MSTTNTSHLQKMRNWKQVFCFTIYLVCLLPVVSSQHSDPTKCYTKMISTCKNNEITTWNRKNVGKHIKEWIKSVVIEFYKEEQLSSEIYCKAFIMKEMPFFSRFGPDVISPYGVILGNTSPQNNRMPEAEPSQSEEIEPSMTLHFDGPVWADLNNDQEWLIENHPDKIEARLLPDAILRNGLHYGILNNNVMKIGR